MYFVIASKAKQSMGLLLEFEVDGKSAPWHFVIASVAKQSSRNFLLRPSAPAP